VSQTWIQDLLIQDQDQDSAVSRPRPRPRLKTYKTNTGSPWLGWTVTNKKTEKVIASRKYSILVVAHSKQQNIILSFHQYVHSQTSISLNDT